MNNIISNIQMQDARTKAFNCSLYREPCDGDEVFIACSLHHDISEIAFADGYMYSEIELNVSFKSCLTRNEEEIGECGGKYALRIRMPVDGMEIKEFEEQAELIGLNTLIPYARAITNACLGAMQTGIPYQLPLIDVNEMISTRKINKQQT